ncbi:TonB-dependent receptor, partial [Pseudomonas aeruginosa]|nr:TonB-dependent receptor [Pseudomonas aeruginosa]
MHFSLRSRHLRPSLLASSLLLAVSAQGQEKLDVDLPAAPLGQAINALAQQSSVQILFAGDLGAGRQAPALKGRFTPEEALRQLLRDSGLKAQARDEHTFIVVPASEAAVPATQARSEPLDMEQMEITASRTSSDLVSATRQSTVIEHAQLEELRQGSDSLATVLAKAVPGMSDSSRTITEYGQTLRGRSMLVMVDGVPLNTNRDSSRNLANIDPALIERIEVIRGSSAIYGSGATGGIISITTRPAGGENRAETRLSATSPLTRLGSDGLGGQFQQYFAGSLGALDYSFDFGTRHVGASYDAHGDRIAPEPSQGDLFDSNVYNIGGKLGLRIDENQRVQLALSHYDARQDTDYATDPRVARLPPGSVPANAIKGLELDEQNRIRNTLANLEYENLDILGSRLSAQLYYRDYFTRFTPFDARAVSTRGGNVDQIMQNSEVFGSRLTLRTPLGESGNTELVWGGDYNQERSDMPLDVFDPAAYDASGGLVFDKIGKLTYMPPLRTRSAGAFAQLQHRFDEHWSIDGGLRYEYSTAEFDDFIPLSESKAASPVTVKGGDLDYDAVLSNLGIVYSPVAGQEIYASFSQGFQLPDVGIQLRNARRGFDIGSSNLEPVKTNNYELGWRGAIGGNTLGSLALFYTTSKLGDVQSFNNGLILTRTKERIYGVEASADWLSDDEVWGAGGSATWMRGREKPDGKDWQDMTGYRVPPLKLTAYLQYLSLIHI